jgi:Secreted repeat of unknown function
LLRHGHLRATGAVQETLLGTTERADGSSQITYAGHPLSYYGDEDPTRTLCHNVTEFGGRWLVVTPDGFEAYPEKDNQDEKIKQKIDPPRSELSRMNAVLEQGAQAFKFASVPERMATLFAEDDESRPSGP